MLGNEVKRNFQVGQKLCPDVAGSLSLEENKKILPTVITGGYISLQSKGNIHTEFNGFLR
jgi:hypothetical protein